MTTEPFKFVSAEEKPDHDPANYTAGQSRQKELDDKPQGRKGDMPSESSAAEDKESNQEALRNVDTATESDSGNEADNL